MLRANSFDVDKFFEDLSQDLLTVWRQLNGVADSVYDPAQDDLAGVPATIPLEQLFEGDGFVAVWFVCRGFGEHAVDHVQ